MTAEEPLPPAEESDAPEKPSRRKTWIVGGSITGAIALVAVVAVAASAALNPGAVTSAPTSSPHASSASSTPTTSPSPTESDWKPPVGPVALDVACDELIPDALVASMMAPDVSLMQDSGDTAWSFSAATLRQEGGVSCRWADEVLLTASQEELTLEVLPRASAEYTRYVEVSGDAPGAGCFVGTSLSQVGCAADILVGEFWARLELLHRDAPRFDDPEKANAMLAGLLSAVAEGLGGVSAPQPWVVPDSASSPGAICAAAPTVPGLEFGLEPLGYSTGVASLADFRQDVSWCGGPAYSPGFRLYPGSAWAWEEILAGAEISGELARVEIAGADAAAVVGGEDDDGRGFTFLSLGGAILVIWDTEYPSELARDFAASYAAAH